jgi:ferredoxin
MLIVNGKNLKSTPGETVLQTIERNGLQINSGCRDGFCGSCRCHKVKGAHTLVVEPLAYCHTDELIACVSLTPEIGVLEIQY